MKQITTFDPQQLYYNLTTITLIGTPAVLRLSSTRQINKEQTLIVVTLNCYYILL